MPKRSQNSSFDNDWALSNSQQVHLLARFLILKFTFESSFKEESAGASDVTNCFNSNLNWGISERCFSSKVALRRLDCIGSCGDRTKYQQIFLRTHIHCSGLGCPLLMESHIAPYGIDKSQGNHCYVSNT